MRVSSTPKSAQDPPLITHRVCDALSQSCDGDVPIQGMVSLNGASAASDSGGFISICIVYCSEGGVDISAELAHHWKRCFEQRFGSFNASKEEAPLLEAASESPNSNGKSWRNAQALANCHLQMLFKRDVLLVVCSRGLTSITHLLLRWCCSPVVHH